MFYRSLLFFACLFLFFNQPSEAADFPVLYKGRFRPAEAYARLWLNDVYHSQSLKSQHLSAFNLSSSDALDFLWELHFLGPTRFQNMPLFWIQSATLKQALGLALNINRFNLNDLIKYLNAQPHLDSRSKEEGLQLLSKIENVMQSGFQPHPEYPLKKQLQHAGHHFYALPGRSGEWYSLHALRIQAPNFTLYTDQQFEQIREAYFLLEKAVLNHGEVVAAKQHFSAALMQGYTALAGSVYQEAAGKVLRYPTKSQLQMEHLYLSYPLIKLLIGLYLLSALFIFLFKDRWFGRLFLVITFLLHTALLAIRCYILQRPPVSNMAETVIYVPWAAVLVSLILNLLHPRACPKQGWTLAAACIGSIFLLTLLELTDLNPHLDQVQAVLDSQFWLIIHVLMIVASYGVFILSAIYGHFYLGLYLYHRQETETMKFLAHLILQTMYLGIALLIPGTILGGIWAAESWGRFWDWDPKESWAFISSCFYLITLHAFRFRKIGNFGLAMGSISGAIAISFTWYGVNYILGTGLHSYGFGSGGETYYYLYISMELLFIGVVSRIRPPLAIPKAQIL